MRQIETIKTPGRHADGRNLYLNVTPSGSRSWVFFYSLRGRQREMGLGPYPDVGLAKARDMADAKRKLLLEGIDPLEVKQREEALPTFGEFVQEYLAANEEGWKPSTRRLWHHSLKVDAADLAPLRIDRVDTPAILSVLKPIWLSKPETATRVRGRIEAVLLAAKAQGHREGLNPARWGDHLKALLPKQSKIEQHHAALPFEQVSEVLERLAKSQGLSAQALSFLIITACRSSEVRGARWGEIDVEKKVWTIPAHRMKGHAEHRVPLTKPALRILNAVDTGDGSGLIFPGERSGKPLSDTALAKALKAYQPTATVHGFRSSFRDWAGERTSFPSDVAEMALAHKIRNKVEAAYRRGSLFEKRREMMEAWSAFCFPTAA